MIIPAARAPARNYAICFCTDWQYFSFDFSLYGSDATPDFYSPPSPPNHAYTPTGVDPYGYPYDPYENDKETPRYEDYGFERDRGYWETKDPKYSAYGYNNQTETRGKPNTYDGRDEKKYSYNREDSTGSYSYGSQSRGQNSHPYSQQTQKRSSFDYEQDESKPSSRSYDKERKLSGQSNYSYDSRTDSLEYYDSASQRRRSFKGRRRYSSHDKEQYNDLDSQKDVYSSAEKEGYNSPNSTYTSQNDSFTSKKDSRVDYREENYPRDNTYDDSFDSQPEGYHDGGNTGYSQYEEDMRIKTLAVVTHEADGTTPQRRKSYSSRRGSTTSLKRKDSLTLSPPAEALQRKESLRGQPETLPVVIPSESLSRKPSVSSIRGSLHRRESLTSQRESLSRRESLDKPADSLVRQESSRRSKKGSLERKESYKSYPSETLLPKSPETCAYRPDSLPQTPRDPAHRGSYKDYEDKSRGQHEHVHQAELKEEDKYPSHEQQAGSGYQSSKPTQPDSKGYLTIFAS